MDATIASALVIGAVTILLIVALSALALTHLRGGNFEQVNVPLSMGARSTPTSSCSSSAWSC
jgi:hypothetical protein